MKVVINPQQQPRKEYKNLPEREPHKINRPRPKRMIVEDEPVLDPLELEQEAEIDEEIDAAVEETPAHPWLHGKRAAILFLGVLIALGSAAYFAFGFEQDLMLEKITVEGNRLVWNWSRFQVPLDHFHYDTFATPHEVLGFLEIDPFHWSAGRQLKAYGHVVLRSFVVIPDKPINKPTLIFRQLHKSEF